MNQAVKHARYSVIARLVCCALLAVVSNGQAAPEPTSKPPVRTEAAIPLSAIQRFVDIFERVKQGYVQPVSDEQLFDQSIKGMLTGLDPYSDYLSPEEYARIQEFTDGELGQVGLTVIRSGENWQVGSVTPEGPADKASLKPGDQITRINGRVLRNLALSDVEQMLRGPRGSAVLLQVASGDRPPRAVRLQRLNLEDNQVIVKSAGSGIVVLQIGGFQSQTAQQVTAALDGLASQGALRGIVLDLRDNPGGLLSAAVEMADLMLAKGEIVSTRGQREPEERFTATSGDRYAGIPIAVLINRYSASAAEVLAAALQQNRRAKLYGEASYGKGSIQKLWPVADGRAIKMTVAYYYLPDGRRLEGQGLRPDSLIAAASDRPATSGIDVAQRQVAQALLANSATTKR